MSIKGIVGWVVAGFLVLMVMVAGMGSFYTVDETERGVLLRNGAFVKVVEPGLAFKVPFIDSVKTISVQSQASVYQNLQAYSKDNQTATIRASVSWHIPPAEVGKVYSQYKDTQSVLDRLISRQVPQQVENVFGQYNAVTVVQNRGKFVTDVTNAIKTAVVGPVVIDSVQIENIDFSDDYEKSIALRMKAEVEVTTREQQLKTEQVQAQIQVTQAQAKADSKLAQARAEAEATKLQGNAEAEAISVRAKALASNENLVNLTAVEKWNGTLPTTMVPGSSVPFINVNEKK